MRDLGRRNEDLRRNMKNFDGELLGFARKLRICGLRCWFLTEDGGVLMEIVDCSLKAMAFLRNWQTCR